MRKERDEAREMDLCQPDPPIQIHPLGPRHIVVDLVVVAGDVAVAATETEAVAEAFMMIGNGKDTAPALGRALKKDVSAIGMIVIGNPGSLTTIAAPAISGTTAISASVRTVPRWNAPHTNHHLQPEMSRHRPLHPPHLHLDPYRTEPRPSLMHLRLALVKHLQPAHVL